MSLINTQQQQQQISAIVCTHYRSHIDRDTQHHVIHNTNLVIEKRSLYNNLQAECRQTAHIHRKQTSRTYTERC